MVFGLEKVVAVIAGPFSRSFRPDWVDELFARLSRIERQVRLLMSFDVSVLTRLLVGAQFLADQHRKDKATIADLTSKLQAADAAAVADTQADQAATDAATKVADEVDALVKGDQTPTVEVPSDPADVVDVVSGNTDPVVTDPGPVSDGTLTDSTGSSGLDSGPAQGPASGGEVTSDPNASA